MNNTKQKQQQNQNQQEQQYNDHPLITYSNRIQKHLHNLTEELANTETISQPEKRKLLLIIANLPPQAKTTLQKETQQLETNKKLTTQQYRQIYSTTSDWIYNNILQDAFKIIKPIITTNTNINGDNTTK